MPGLETYLWEDDSGNQERTVVATASVNVNITGVPGITVPGVGVVAVRDWVADVAAAWRCCGSDDGDRAERNRE